MQVLSLGAIFVSPRKSTSKARLFFRRAVSCATGVGVFGGQHISVVGVVWKIAILQVCYLLELDQFLHGTCTIYIGDTTI